jgi:hypothetical protein
MVRGLHEQAHIVQWERSFEISKKIRKRTNFGFLIFRIRLKVKKKGKRLMRNESIFILMCENYNNIFDAKFEGKSYNFGEANRFQDELLDEIQKRTKLEKKCLLNTIFHQQENDECSKSSELENRINYGSDEYRCWNTFCTINYPNGTEDDGRKEIWNPGWGLIIRIYQKVEFLLVLIDFNSILINPDSILISRYSIHSTRSLFMDTALKIFKFVKKYLNAKYLKTVEKDVEVVMKACFNDKRKILNWIKVMITINVGNKDNVKVIFCSDLEELSFQCS